MEDDLRFNILQRALEEKLGIHNESDQYARASLRLIYDSSRQWILDVADSMTRGMIRDGEDLKFVTECKEPDLPKKEKWDFKLGDMVTVKCSREDFKWMQKKTLGWKKTMNQAYGCVGIVRNVTNEFDANIGVLYPAEYYTCTLYAGVLKKVDPVKYTNLNPRWKFGDYVKTIACRRTLRLLQQGFESLPDEYVGKKGRVIAATHLSVMVTFDEVKTYDIKSSALLPCKDKSPIYKRKVTHARGFKVGEQVRVISNVKKLMENQIGHGGWHSTMCDLVGKIATIILVVEDGDLVLRPKYKREWRINSDSVLRLLETESVDDDVTFSPGDIVKVIVPRNIGVILAMFRVPTVFLEFLRTTTVVCFVDADCDYLVRFNKENHLEIVQKLLRHATTSEKQKYERIEKKVKNLKVGDKVYLDIGPPNYVRPMVQELDMDPTVAMAMVKSATLIGFIDAHTTMIEYENGAKFRVKKKYLTVPEKFCFVEPKDTLNLDIATRIYDAISQSVEDIHSKMEVKEDWKVETTFMSCGSPPCVEYKINSTAATFDFIFDWFEQNSGWGVVFLCKGQFLVQNIDRSDLEIKIGITFNDEESVFDTKHIDLLPEVTTAIIEEEPPKKQKAVPFRAHDEAARQRVEPPAREGQVEPAVDPPGPDAVGQFKYMKLHDPALAQDVFIPYVLQGPPREPAQPAANNNENQRPNNVYNIQNVEYLNA